MTHTATGDAASLGEEYTLCVVARQLRVPPMLSPPVRPAAAARPTHWRAFGLTPLTTTGYGDMVPLDPFARGLANLESVNGQFDLAITVARLVTLELEGRRR